MIILGIETSCDETAAAVVRGLGGELEVLSNIVSSQIKIHEKYGGVVPEVAARQHVLNILPVVNEALSCVKKIDAIAVTIGPGLITSLLVGVETAKTLAYAWKKPVVAVNHIEGHIYANWLKPISVISKSQIPISKKIQNTKYPPAMQASLLALRAGKIQFPALVLTVSGGHTMLVLMSGHGKYKVLGETRDDAAGEAFDKAAQLLGLGYPGGPAIAEQARKYKIQNTKYIILPRPMLNSGDFDFSFSGLKTALLYAIQNDKNWKKKIPEYAYEFQLAVAEVLVHKTIKAALKYNCQNIMLSGGVAANVELRDQLKSAVSKKLTGASLIIPDFKYCTDNAAMIAAAGYFQASAGWRKINFTPWQKLKADANQELR
ncbi:MAG: tRNA (adenosine(37)-N6)-threonylcarbamoyltransferase complex transferase subunit TsaD [Parcubacteria group bacterium]|nr:tRNA (adenosine(37)-N6)-threonylcarbamoyltransferase complex transferase subunit TsaD [Parcubacteria group bacterium]